MTWVKALTLRQLESRTAHLAVLPGNREIVKFITPQRREQLAALFQQAVGRPVKVELDAPPAGEASGPAGDRRAAPASPSAVGASAPGPTGQSDRQKAMGLPLVRQVLELFDATIIDVRPEASEAAGAAESAAGAGGAPPPVHRPRRRENLPEDPPHEETEDV
jgi:hypothetical protein